MIRLKNVAKTFPGRAGPVSALEGVDLNIAKGKIFGIIGSSGAGKSTLVRLINLLERPTGGDVFVEGERITDLRGKELRGLRRKIGMVFQHFNLLNAKTVAANVAYPLQLTGEFGKAEIADRVGALLARVGLSEHAHKYPAQLSGGQKQRVGIARALATQPKVLLCDEATSALDPQTTASVLDLLQEINEEMGVTIVLITHEMDVIRRACDEVAVLHLGRVVESGPVADVFLHPDHAATLQLVREAEPEGALLSEDLVSAPLEHAVRLTFLGPVSRNPLLSRVARENGVDYTILAGRVGHVRHTAYAQFTVSLSGRDVVGAVAALKAGGARVDAIGPEPQLGPPAAATERLRHVV